MLNASFSKVEYYLNATDLWQQGAKNTSKGADSDNSDGETGFSLSPQMEKNYQQVNQEFSDMFDGKSVRFTLSYFFHWVVCLTFIV